MIAIVWEFIVKRDAVLAFTETYGPDGPWATLFGAHEGFAGTTLLVPASGHAFFTIDRWQTEGHFETMRETGGIEYDRIDAIGNEWTYSERQLGIFPTDRAFVVVSGLPGAGKSTLAGMIGQSFSLTVVDKDEILDRLFEARGIGDAGWRRVLSRESDEIMKREALISAGAVLTSFWHVPGMDANSGTPTDWVPSLSDRVVHVHCVCPADVAASRFHTRSRHPGHRDQVKSLENIKVEMNRLDALAPPALGARIDVDTGTTVDGEELAKKIRSAIMPDSAVETSRKQPKARRRA